MWSIPYLDEHAEIQIVMQQLAQIVLGGPIVKPVLQLRSHDVLLKQWKGRAVL